MLHPLVVLVAYQPPASSLSKAWERLYWSVEARGPLLLFGGEEPLHQGLPRESAGGYNALALVEHFDRQLVRCGSVTTIATRTMRQYDPPRSLTALATQLRDINPEPYWLLLIASLSSSQRQEAASQQGLALSSLESRQSRWLESALPPTATFRLSRPGQPERTTLRLHLSRQLELEVFAKGRNDSSYQPTGFANDSRVQRATLTLREPESADDDDQAIFLGRPLVKSRAKPSALDPNAAELRVSVALEGASTVKALLARLSKATGLSLLAEKTLGELPVRARGKSARAGDVLAALCRGVNGGFRRVGPVFFLVEELPTMVERRQRANADYQRFLIPQEQEVQQLSQLAAGARRRLIRDGVLMTIPRSPQDVPSSLWTLAERFDTETRVPYAQLTPGLQSELMVLFEAQKDSVERLGGVLPEVPAEATAQQKLVIELLSPETGGRAAVAELSAEALRQDQPLPEPPGPLSIPSTVVTRAWQIALPTEDESPEALFALAKSRGITQLRVPVHPRDEAALAKLTRAAKAERLGVVPIFSPLCSFGKNALWERDATGLTLAQWSQAHPSTSTPSERLGQALKRWEFVTPEALEVAGVVGFARRLAALPGVTGIGLAGLAAPGYPEALLPDRPFWWGGFTLGQRLVFLWEHQVDPADLIAPSPFPIGNLAGELAALGELWEAQQRQRRDRALARLHSALLAAKLTLPLMVRAGSAERSGHWQRWQGVQPDGSLPYDARPAQLHINLLAYDTRLSGLGSDLTTLFEADAQLREWLDMELQPVIRPTPGQPELWDGFVVDVSDRPLAAALLLLERAFAPHAS